MKLSNYREVREYLEGFIKPVVFERITPAQAKIQDPLGRMRYFLSLLGNPQNKLKSILVGGTAGKGSTAYLISHILKTAGYKVGLTISPHLEKINERMQINGQPISDKNLISIVSSIVGTIELMKKSGFGEPSYFEILVALAFQHFACPQMLRIKRCRRAKERVDIAVVEVGLGGKYDATNTLNPLISVLTNVSLDHTQILGKTVERIAWEKVGIIKGAEVRRESALRSLCQFENSSNASVPAVLRQAQDLGIRSPSATLVKNLSHAKSPRANPCPIVITGVKQPSVVKIVEDKCKEVGGELYRLGKDFSFEIKKEGRDGTVFDLTATRDRVKKLNDLRLSLLGKYQVENASLAIEAVLRLGKFGFDVDEQYISKALKTAFFPGRFEVLRLTSFAQDKISSTLILDGAHNPTKMKAFIQTLKKLYPKNRKIFIIAFKKDKDIKGMLKQILSAADSIIVTEFHVTTDVSKNAAMPIKNIKSNKNIKTYFKKDSKKALGKALRIARSKDDLIIITGSLYLVGEMRNFFSPRTGSGNWQKAK